VLWGAARVVVWGAARRRFPGKRGKQRVFDNLHTKRCEMLVLKRRIDDCVLIDGNICVRVLGVTGKSVRIGIEAPAYVHIRRGELPLRTDANLCEVVSPLHDGLLPAIPAGGTTSA